MEKRSGRMLMLLSMVFVFCCLLLSGGSNLIAGSDEENAIPIRSVSAIRAVLSSASAPRMESSCAPRSGETINRLHAASAPDRQVLTHRVQSDANGNVIASSSYMRAVYQVFVLDDGFV